MLVDCCAVLGLALEVVAAVDGVVDFVLNLVKLVVVVVVLGEGIDFAVAGLDADVIVVVSLPKVWVPRAATDGLDCE